MANPVRESQFSVESALLIEPDVRASQFSAEVALQQVYPVRVSQFNAEVAIIQVPPEECDPVVIDAPASVASRYYINLYDTNGSKVALFDNFVLEYGNTINGLGYFSVNIRGDDLRRILFTVDGLVEVMRSVPGAGLTWYSDFHGLSRRYTRGVNERGESYVQFVGTDLNDLLARTIIHYKATTPQASKSGVGETVMKEYVEENCGALATIANGRLYEGTLPGFSVEPDGGLGASWSGDHAYENLLDVLGEIANATGIDYNVVLTGYPFFEFKTYENQMGVDRTVGNADGNQPVVFSVELGNVTKYERTVDYMSERNVVSILGDGEDVTRVVYTLDNTTGTGYSPWNRREIAHSVSANNDLVAMQYAAIETLFRLQARESLDFIPMQQPSLLYALHYNVGDKVTVIEDGNSYNKRLVAKKVRIAEGNEEISFDFRDVP